VRNRRMRTFALMLLVTALTLWVSVPAQAALPQESMWQVVGHASISNELGQVNQLPILQPVNGMAHQIKSMGSCPDGHGCAWLDANYGGAMLDIVWSTIHGHCNNLFSPWQDSITSTWLRFGSGYGMNWYINAACPSGTFTHYVQGSHTFISSFSSTFNNVITSFWDNCCSIA